MRKTRNWVNGDVLVDELTRQPFLFWKMEEGKIFSHCGIDSNGRFCMGYEDWTNPRGCRLADELEKKRLEKEMKKRGLLFLSRFGYVDIIHKDAICYTALEHYGPHHQIVKCMEECGELIRALARHLCEENNRENVVEELADVDIMLAQMRYVFGQQDTARARVQKLARLKMRMEEEEE